MRQVLRAGALGRPRGMGWGGRWEGGSGWGTHVNPWLIHVNVWQKPLQYCKGISLQLMKINGGGGRHINHTTTTTSTKPCVQVCSAPIGILYMPCVPVAVPRLTDNTSPPGQVSRPILMPLVPIPLTAATLSDRINF